MCSKLNSHNSKLIPGYLKIGIPNYLDVKLLSTFRARAIQFLIKTRQNHPLKIKWDRKHCCGKSHARSCAAVKQFQSFNCKHTSPSPKKVVIFHSLFHTHAWKAHFPFYLARAAASPAALIKTNIAQSHGAPRAYKSLGSLPLMQLKFPKWTMRNEAIKLEKAHTRVIKNRISANRCKRHHLSLTHSPALKMVLRRIYLLILYLCLYSWGHRVRAFIRANIANPLVCPRFLICGNLCLRVSRTFAWFTQRMRR